MLLNESLVKEIRINKGWTQAQLADLCAVNIRTIQRVESDGLASLETTMALASAFGLETKDLFADPKTKNNYKIIYLLLGLLAGFILGLLFWFFILFI
jgi:transcriptional regulator with XRE-family HTH domain